jgi:pantothenate kinase
MDGFHLAGAELRRLGRSERKGAVDTFDAAGYAALLGRLRAGQDGVYAPEFRREIEEPIAGAIRVPASVPLVITEGNYLLVWDRVRELLDESWYLECDPGLRLDRLIRRHERFGKPPEQARAWALGSDERNAEVIAASRPHAGLIVRITSDGPRPVTAL